MSYEYKKRAFDLIVAVTACLCLWPLVLIVAVAVKSTSPGPVIHWSERIGRHNATFRMAKFRTMKTDTPQLATHLMQNPEAYLSPIGAFLRRTSLDELPQLYNIVIGDISLVGPRPALFNQDDLIRLRTDAGVHQIPPGLTGLAQILGRDDNSIREKVRLDRHYLRHRTFTLDLVILMRTVGKVLKGAGVSH